MAKRYLFLIHLRLMTIALLALVADAAARELQLPMRFDDELMRRHLISQAFTDADTTARVWDDGSGCNYLVLTDPKVHAQDDLVLVQSRAMARIGTLVGEGCVRVLDWSGIVEIIEQPLLGETPGVVDFQVVDSRLYERGGESQGITGTVWNGMKRHVHPRLERLRLDLNPMLAELKAMLPVVLPKDHEQAGEALDSVTLTEVKAADGQLGFTVRVDVPEQLIAPPVPVDAEPALSHEELERWAQTWRDWDAFITLVIRRAADEATPELRAELRAVLLEARRDIYAILTSPPSRSADPVRALFVETWSRLAPILKQESSGLPSQSALRWLSFVSAADALQTIDEMAPDLGFTLSADALRRLARVAVPDLPAEAFDYSIDVDPELRRALGFGEPLPAPRPNPDATLILPFFFKSARAAEPYDALVERLNGWAPTLTTLDEYLPLVGKLLGHTADATLSQGEIPPAYSAMFEPLVLATAWQESCWRQYVVHEDRYVPISSGTGSVGIMQVNQYVWRGFYDVQGLNWDIGYNARAGAEILRHYLVDYAIARGEETRTDNIENLARATYAMYNGGPSHMTRYRSGDTPASLRAIDDAFWEKFQAVRDGDPFAVAKCYADS